MGIPYSLFGNYSGIKRQRVEDDIDDIDVPSTSVRKKLKTTDYIYKQLFIGGEGSDVTVYALGKEWHLHKVYLAQSPYFSIMFNGSWAESKQKAIFISIPNKVITVESLNHIFGSLYKDEIEVNSEDVISLVAAATLLQLESVISQCADVMSGNINIKNVMKFYEASEENGLPLVRDHCIKWMCNNLLRYSNHGLFLKGIDIGLMKILVSSSELFVIQGEIDLYSLLKKWIYVRLNTFSRKLDSSLKNDADNFLSISKSLDSFLETPQGIQFRPVFSCLRLCHMLNLDKTLQTVMEDHIIPKHIIEKILALQWKLQLIMEGTYDLTMDKGFDINHEDFNRKSIRCGRVLSHDIPHCWRWSGFFYGVDILLSYKHRVISIKRNCVTQSSPYSVNLKNERTIYYRLSAIRFDKCGRVAWQETTKIEKLSLKADDVSMVIKIPGDIEFPLTIGFWYTVLPLDRKTVEMMDACEWEWENSVKKYSSFVAENEEEETREISSFDTDYDCDNYNSADYE